MGREVETLAENNDLYVLTFINNDREKQLFKQLDVKGAFSVRSNSFLMGIRVILGFWRPVLLSSRSSISFALKLINVVKKYDIEAIHAEYTSMGHYLWIKKFFPNLEFNLVEHDVTAQSYARKRDAATGLKKSLMAFETRRIERYESKYCHAADVVMALSQKDVKLLKTMYNLGDKAKKLNPYFGIDLDSSSAEEAVKQWDACFAGQMGRSENDLAAQRLISLFHKPELKEWSLRIIGAHPSDKVLASQDDRITVSGFVDDINQEILSCKLAVYPLMEGAGIKFKVLLSMSLGVPVVTTAIGAEGIDEEGNALVLAETDEEILYAIKHYLSDQDDLDRLAERGKAFVKENFSWETSRQLFSAIYQKTE